MSYHGLTQIGVSKNKRLLHGFFGLVCMSFIVSRLLVTYLEGDEGTMNLKNIWKFILGKGIKVGYSTGRPFDPHYQERTDPIKDMMEADKKRREKNKTNKK